MFKSAKVILIFSFLLAIVECDDPNLVQDKGVRGCDGQRLTEEAVSQLKVTGQSILEANVEDWQMTAVDRVISNKNVIIYLKRTVIIHCIQQNMLSFKLYKECACNQQNKVCVCIEMIK